MLKKIITICICITINVNQCIIAYNFTNLKSILENKLDTIEQKIEKKYKQVNKVCDIKINYYKKLYKLITEKQSKYSSKFKEIFEILKQTINQKQNIVKNECSHTIKWDYFFSANITLKKLIQAKKYYTNWTIKLTYEKTSPQIPKISQIQQKKDFCFKIDNNWFYVNWYTYFKIDNWYLNVWLKQAQQNNPDHIFYILSWNYYYIYLIDSEKLTNLFPFDPSLWFEQNIEKLTQAGYIYLKNFYYTKTNQNWVIVSGLTEYNNNIYFLSHTTTWAYTIIDEKWIYKITQILPKWSIIIHNNNNLIWYLSGFKLYYIWPKFLYNNINMEKLWKILEHNFNIIWEYNIKYSVKDMYQLIEFSLKFDRKKLSDLYKWITKNITYNKQVSKFLNIDKLNQEQLNKKVSHNPNLIKFFILFYILQKKVWVCQSISDLLSIVSIFNWLKADTINWISKEKWYLHQISKIEKYYYDPTYDLTNNIFKYFSMNLKKVKEYLKLDN